jgi:DNA-binding NarL/FixJ family response regulator
MRQSFTTVLVGPSELLREGLIRILNAEKFRILSSAASVCDLLQKPLPHQRPILLIIDVDAPDAHAGFAQIADFKAVYASSHVVALADHCRSDYVVSAFRAGADAYLTKVAPRETFIKTLELVMLGQTVLPAETSTCIQDIRPDMKNIAATELTRVPYKSENEETERSVLSNRERSILRCLMGGESNKTIARKINIAEATVKAHVKAILRKIRVRNRTQAAVWAMNHDVLTPEPGNGLLSSHDPPELIESQKGHHLRTLHPM